MQAPSVGGVRLPKGKGEVIRLPRGASLTDFADKIGANPASLVQVLFHLGEMVTATESVNEETLQVLGTELEYDVQLVSPEDEDRELLAGFDLDLDQELEDESDEDADSPYTQLGHWVKENVGVNVVEVFKKVQELGIEKKHKAVQVLAQTLFTSDILTEIPGYIPIFQKVCRYLSLPTGKAEFDVCR